ncbi:S9 family peptidase [bacterium]|nr:S9 family peptidase [bacterium]
MKKLFLPLFLTTIFISCNSSVEKKDKNMDNLKNSSENSINLDSKKLSISDYINIEGSNSGYILKNGDKLYLSRKKENASQLFLEKADKTSKQLTNHEDAVDNYYVSPQESKILYLISKGGSEQYDFYIYDFKTDKTEPLLVDEKIRFEEPIWLNDNEILFSSNEETKKDFYIYHLNLTTKEKTLLVKKDGYNIITDALSKNNFLFITFIGNTIIEPFHYQNGNFEKIKGADKKRKYIPIGFFMNATLMLTNENSDMDYLQLWDNGEKKDIFKDKWSVESAVIDRRRENAVFCTNNQGYSSCYHLKSTEIREFPDKNSENSGTNIYFEKTIKELPLKNSVIELKSISNGSVVYDMMNPDRIITPEAINLENYKTESFGYKFSNNIDVSQFVAPELRKVKSFDGVEIPYFLYLPKNMKGPFKTIVYFHGGPEAQFRPYFITTFQYYLQKGFAIVAPNVRGSSGYGSDFMDLDNYKLRMNSVKDGKAILDQLIEQKISIPNSFIAMGGSYGGFMVVASMAEYPKQYSCGVNTVGVVDFINFLENTASYRRELREIEYGPLTDKEFLKFISPTNMVDTIEGELYIFHGANDPRVPVSDAYILIDKMEKAGKTVFKHIFDDEGHGFRKKENRVIYYNKTADFLENCSKK